LAAGVSRVFELGNEQRLAAGRERARLGQSNYLKPHTGHGAAANRPLRVPSGEWNDDDYDVLADGVVVGRILKVHAAPVGTPWMWTLAFGHHEDRTPTHGYAASREAATAAFAKSSRRE
jgi:hypothetical protein